MTTKTLTTAEALTAYAALNVLAKRALPVRVTYALARSRKALHSVAEDYDTARRAVLAEHADEGEGGALDWHEGGREAAEAANAELLGIEVEVAIHTVGLDALDGREIEGDLLEPLLDVVFTDPEG